MIQAKREKSNQLYCLLLGSENMDKKKIIDKLNDILRYEWTGLAQYAQCSFVITGLWREVYSGMFDESAKECFGHAKLIGEKIAALGGVPTIERGNVQQTNDLNEMLQNALEFEQGAVEHYNEALALADGHDRALVVLLEDILLQEQEGVDEIEKILRDASAAAPAQGSAASQTA